MISTYIYMSGRIWNNQYIELASTLPGALLSLSRSSISESESAILENKLSSFSKRYVEIGSGSGGHLIEQARRDPTGLYLGVELRYKRAFRTAEKAVEYGINNLFVARAEISQVLPVLTKYSFEGFYINFPDPWARRRWHKHRILNEGFIQKIHEMLSPGGFLSYKTDHREYFDDTAQVLKQLGGFEICGITNDLHSCTELLENNVESEFEVLFRSKKMPVNYLLARRPLN